MLIFVLIGKILKKDLYMFDLYSFGKFSEFL